MSGFKVPSKELEIIQKSLIGDNKKFQKMGYEFFMSSPALLIRIENEDWLKEI